MILFVAAKGRHDGLSWSYPSILCASSDVGGGSKGRKDVKINTCLTHVYKVNLVTNKDWLLGAVFIDAEFYWKPSGAVNC